VVLASSVLAAAGTDEDYSDYFIAPPSAIIDLNSAQVKGVEKAPLDDFFADVKTDVNFNLDSKTMEQQLMDQVELSANFIAAKGPVYVQYTHANISYKDIFVPGDAYQTITNNRVTIGFSFTPGQASQASQPAASQPSARRDDGVKAASVSQ